MVLLKIFSVALILVFLLDPFLLFRVFFHSIPDFLGILCLDPFSLTFP